jgi:hypothetical protein
MTIVHDKIAEFTAELEREVETPSGDLGYGSDLSCTDDITPDADEIPGDSLRALAESNYRRVTTRRGSIPDAPDDGVDINDYLNQGITPEKLAEIPGILKNELEKDDRNEPGSVAVVMTPTGADTYDIAISGTAAAGPFSLTFAVKDGEATLKEINGAHA